MNEVSIDLDARRAIEAIVLAAVEPVEPGMLAQLLELPVRRVEEMCQTLADEYALEGRGFAMVRVAGGYRFQTHPDAVQYVERFVLDGRHARLSGAALETLAIIAYKQPISRAQISAIRGVNVDATLRTLVQRGYVDEVGHDAGPGQPSLFGTTSLFLERVGLDSLRELPALADFVPEPAVVEALERGLRVTPAADDANSDASPGDADEDGGEAPVDEDQAGEVVAIAKAVAVEKVDPTAFAEATESDPTAGVDGAAELVDPTGDTVELLADELRAGLDLDLDAGDEPSGP